MDHSRHRRVAGQTVHTPGTVPAMTTGTDQPASPFSFSEPALIDMGDYALLALPPGHDPTPVMAQAAALGYTEMSDSWWDKAARCDFAEVHRPSL